MRIRTSRLVAVGGALALPVGLAWADVIVGPLSGVERFVFWPAEILLLAVGPGVPLHDGGYEWTPVQDFATWLGIGLSWFFWLTTVRLITRSLHLRKPRKDAVESLHE
jgi:hypothetical protein